MNVGVNIDVLENVGEGFAELISMLEGAGRVQLHQAMGLYVQQETAEHLSDIAHTRHATAERIGAAPTGFWADAAERVESPSALSADASGATLTIAHPGIKRAFQSVTIVPVRAAALAFPIHEIAYGHRAAELWDALKLFIPKGSSIIAMHDASGGILPLFALCRSVTQEQDRTLLPSDQEWEDAAALGARLEIREALAEGGRL